VGDVVVPALSTSWARLPAALRSQALYRLARLASWRPQLPEADVRKAYAFLDAHLDEVPEGAFDGVVGRSDLIPIDRWLPFAPESAMSDVWRVPRETVDEVVRQRAADPAAVTGPLLALAKWKASPEAAQEVYDRLLREGPPPARALAAGHLLPPGAQQGAGYPASAGAIEAALAALLAESPPDLGLVQDVGEILTEIRPTEAVFPAARLLLASGEKKSVLAGIAIADSLGRPALLPDLVAVLSSMDAEVRTAAKAAVDAIHEIRRIQQEEADREAGLVR
jgi:hypothetical protein